MMTRRTSASWLLPLLIALWLTAPCSAQEPIPGDERPTLQEVAAHKATADAALGAIPADAAEGSPAGLRRAALQQQLALLEEHEQRIASATQIATTIAGLDERLAAARNSISNLEDRSPVAAPSSPSQGELTELSAELKAARDKLAVLHAGLETGMQRLEQIPAELEVARARADSARARVTDLASGAASSGDTEQALLELRRANALLEQQAADRQVAGLARERELHAAAEPVLAAEQQLAEFDHEHLEQRFAAYSKAMEEQQAGERTKLEGRLELLRARAAEGESAGERFLATWEGATVQSQVSQIDLDAAIVSLQRDVHDQESRLTAEEEELANLRELVESSGIGGAAAERLKTLFEQLKRRRRLLARSAGSGLLVNINDYRGRRFQVEDLLLGLGDRFREERGRTQAGMSEIEHSGFQRETRDLQERVRTALRGERARLTDAIGLGQDLQAYYLAREETLNRLDSFVRSKVFWVRDAKPLSLDQLKAVPAELVRLEGWAREALSARERDPLRVVLGASGSFLHGLLLFGVLPALLLFLRQKLRRAVREQNQLAVEGVEVSATRLRFRAIALAALSAALLPMFLFAAGEVVRALLPHAAVTPAVSGTLRHLAIFLLGWFLSRAFFAGSAIATAQLGMDREAVAAIHRFNMGLLLAWLLLLLPSRLLLAPPLELEALPRLLFMAFLLVLASCAVRLTRRASPFVQGAVLANPESLASRHWPLLSSVAMLLPCVILVADVLGFRYGACTMTGSYCLSFATLLMIAPAYKAVWVGIEALRTSSAATAVEEEATGSEAKPEELTGARQAAIELAREQAALATATSQQNLDSFVRLGFLVVGAFLVAGYWGLDQDAFGPLDEVTLYSFGDEGETSEILSAADLLRSVLILAGTVIILKAVPGLFDLFSHKRKVDVGLQYALRTIASYAVFALGVLMALGALHLDLSRIGWLVAAMGVGLGFGLQEIVSNFVSGLILLAERPIRVGDIVTVGANSGTVLKINIRSTTILNWDRQEVIVPNRTLITADVTNWTRSDTINRVVVAIGVAYGSDVDLVTEILTGVCADTPGVLDEPASTVFFIGHGASSLDFQIRVFVPTVSDTFSVRDRVNKEINRRLTAAGVEIPFPQQVVHIRGGSLDAPLAEGGSRPGSSQDDAQASRP